MCSPESGLDAGGARHVFSLTTFFTPDEQTTFAFDPGNAVALTYIYQNDANLSLETTIAK